MNEEFIDDRGNRWVVRDCDHEDGCVVIAMFIGRKANAEEEPSYDIHIPADMRQVIANFLVSRLPASPTRTDANGGRA